MSLSHDRAGKRGADPFVRDIDPINNPTDVRLPSPGSYARYIEIPVREAVELLNRWGIRTISSSANSEDIGELGHVSMVYASLSPAQCAEASKLVEERHARRSNRFGREVLIIEFPVHEHDRASDVRDRLMALVARLHP